MKVLVVTNMWPSSKRPHWGAFVKSQVDSLAAAGCENTLYEIQGWHHTIEYFRAVVELPRVARECGAELVHAHFGLSGRFAFGAFGEEAEDRDRLACVAVARAAERYGVPAERCVVVGDTEHDIACARAAGARVVAVATGTRSREVLAAHAPDLLLDDLRDVAGLLEWARSLERDGAMEGA